MARGNGRDQRPRVAGEHDHRHQVGRDVHRTAGDTSRHYVGTCRDSKIYDVMLYSYCLII
jgi:hypothetical protein